jgi:hypothetical protein
MTLLWLPWVATGPASVFAAVALIECGLFLHDQRRLPVSLGRTVAMEACRRSTRRAAGVLLVSLALPVGIWAATMAADGMPLYVAFIVPWYFYLIGFFYLPFLLLPAGLIVAAILVGTYLRRAPARWREAGSRALTAAGPGS